MLDTTTPESIVAGLDARVDLWSDADVVALGWTARTVHELHIVAHGLVRLLVGRLGFRSVLIEGDRETSRRLDALLSGGVGDLQSTLAGARAFLATAEMLDIVRWLQRWTLDNNGERVRVVHDGYDDLSSPTALEHSLADQLLSWHGRSGHRIVDIGGTYHTAAAERTTPAAATDPVPSAGSLLRDALGARYISVGLTFGSGTIPSRSLDRQQAPSRLNSTPSDARPFSFHSATSSTPEPRVTQPDRVRIVGPDSTTPRQDDATTPWLAMPPSRSTSCHPPIESGGPQPHLSPDPDQTARATGVLSGAVSLAVEDEAPQRLPRAGIRTTSSPLSLALLGGRDGCAAAIDAQRERVGDDEDACGPCQGGPDVGAWGALGEQ